MTKSTVWALCVVLLSACAGEMMSSGGGHVDAGPTSPPPLRDGGSPGPVGAQDSAMPPSVDGGGPVSPSDASTAPDAGPMPMPMPMPMPGATLRAFPGAIGFGAMTEGGRGGDVYIVTNTNDDGPGSLREAIDADGPRVVVFETGGTISLDSGLRIGSPYITIAGQTAPGGGIAIRNGDNTGTTLRISTHDVVIRGLRIRPGPGGEPDGIYLNQDASNVIIDHSSISWAVDENVTAAAGAHDITLQWNIIAQGLLEATHNKGKHSMGLMFGNGDNDDPTRDITVHHTLLAHNFRRNPLCQMNGRLDFVNNTIYNWGDDSWSGFAGAFSNNSQTNYIANYILHGPSSNNEYAIDIYSGEPAQVYVEGNISSLHRMSLSDPESDVVEPGDEGGIMGSAFAGPEMPSSSATAAHMDVLASAGAILPMRDSVDAAIVQSVMDGAALIIDDPDEMGGWPTLSAGSAAADTDRDGIPDTFESANGLNPNDPADSSGTDLSTMFTGAAGYTNLEVYINALYPPL